MINTNEQTNKQTNKQAIGLKPGTTRSQVEHSATAAMGIYKDKGLKKHSGSVRRVLN